MENIGAKCEKKMHTSCDPLPAVFTKSRQTLVIILLAAMSLTTNAQDPSSVSPSPLKALKNNAGNKKRMMKSKRVLRHAVFFSFKESSTASDVQGVVDAFAALPQKIDSIKDFQAGTNNSPEGLDDGFTHCFLLTFKNDAGRKTYLPHPSHKEFGSTLGPHLKDVFVLDYWGKTSRNDKNRELKHAVFFKFKDDADPAAITKVEKAFAALPGKIDAIKAFEWGTNNSPESHDDGFTHCFMVTFDSEEGRAKYLPHADHLGFVEILKPVLDKVRVLDFWEDGYQK